MVLIFKYIQLILFIFLFNVHIFNCQSCSSTSKIEDGSSCFNEIIRFGDGFRAGQFTVRQDGILFIEYSSGGDRLFYSLKQNGRGSFSNDSSIYILKDITKDYRNNGNTEAFKRYESKNTLIHIGNDENKQYIFSLSTYYGLTEIHDFDENFNNNHKTWLTTKFLGINDEHRYIFSYQYSLFKGYSNNYYAVYVQY